MRTTVNCPACNKEIIMQAECPHCKFNIEIFEKAKKISIYLYNKGLEKYQKGCVLDAISTLEKCLDFYKNNIVARNLLGILYYQIGEVGDALKHWIISSNMKKEDNPAITYLEEFKNDKKSLQIKNEAIRVYNEAVIYAKQGNDDISVIRLLKAINLSPNLLKAHLLLTLCYYKDEVTRSKARVYFEKAKQIDSNSKIIRYYNRVLDGITEKELQRSSDKNTKKIKNDYKNMRKSKSMKENVVLKKYVSTIIITIVVAFVLIFYLGGSSLQAKNAKLSKANKEYKAQIDDMKLEIENLKGQLDVYVTEENKEENEKNLKEAIEFYNSNQFVESYDKIKLVDKKFLSDDLKLIYEQNYEDIKKEVGRVYYSDGKKLFEDGENAEAIKTLKLALKCAPDESYSGEIMYYIARIYEKENKINKAIEMYNEIVKKFPDTHTAEQAKYRSENLT